MASRRSENISEMSNFEIIKEMEDLLKTVSYTHLDVYKRQAMRRITKQLM